jgi:hypothetical protein
MPGRTNEENYGFGSYYLLGGSVDVKMSASKPLLTNLLVLFKHKLQQV